MIRIEHDLCQIWPRTFSVRFDKKVCYR